MTLHFKEEEWGLCPLPACVHLPFLLNSALCLAYFREEETRFVNLEKLLKKGRRFGEKILQVK